MLLLICTILLTGVAGVLSCRSGLCPRLENGRSSGAREVHSADGDNEAGGDEAQPARRRPPRRGKKGQRVPQAEEGGGLPATAEQEEEEEEEEEEESHQLPLYVRRVPTRTSRQLSAERVARVVAIARRKGRLQSELVMDL